MMDIYEIDHIWHIKPKKDYFATESKCRCDTCKASGNPEEMDPRAKYKFNQLREFIGEPLVCNSGKRCENHPIEAEKYLKKGTRTGQHFAGTAMDIKCKGNLRWRVLRAAIMLGATGIAFGKNFIHIDFREGTPMTWTY